ncbi:MAG: M15 family metallopeptidase [Fimbriimonadales bacterium]
MRSKLSIEEPVSHLRHVPIRENGEPLVSWLGHPRIFQDQPRFNYKRETLARKSVVEFLWRAADALPRGYKLGIIEGWRPPYIQRRMFKWSFKRFKDKYPDWSEAKLKRLASQFTAPMDERVPPPHSTGGAVDLMVADENNQVLDHLSPYQMRDHHAFPFDAKDLSDEARHNRDLLAQALSTGGLTNYPSEYWHWSYGDQGWAYRGRHEHALYGAVTPDGWRPSPEDDTDEPLVYQL